MIIGIEIFDRHGVQEGEKMDIKNLNTFIHVAELNSFTRAAQKLGFSQSTVSFQVKQLEAELKSQLFERINHTVVLTGKGREVLAYAHQINKLTQELKESIEEGAKVAGHVRLAMADSLCDSLLRADFSAFREKNPGITLKLVAAGTEDMFRLLNHNEVDAILTLDNHIYNAEYVIVREEKAEVNFVADARSPLLCREALPVRELVRYPFILPEKGMSYRRLMDEKLAEMSLEVQPILEVGSTDLICTLVGQGVGVSLLPDYVTKKEVDAGRMAYLKVKDFEIQVWKQLLYHRNKWVSPQLEAVLQYCAHKEFS